MDKKRLVELRNIIIIICLALALFIIMHMVCGTSLFGHSVYNSYELQAKAWLDGKVYLENGSRYQYLELAIYNGKYFVSFPPFPSVVLLPFVIIFGDNVPNNFIIFVISTITCIIAYTILRRQETGQIVSIFLAFMYVFASNITSMTMNGGVWFIAQALNMLLCTIAIDSFLKNKRALVYLFLALAVGCRPFSAVYMIAVFAFYCIKDKNKKLKEFVKDNLMPLIPAIVVAVIYMIYNYVRFDNPLEFGHNYLPEFLREQNGQFSIEYLFNNLKYLFLNPIFIDWNIEKGLNMPFCFLIANPLFIVAAYEGIKKVVQNHKISITRLIFLTGIAINIILLCLHKTLGGWQFGARYTCDFLAIAFLCMLIFTKKKEHNESMTNNSSDENGALLSDETLESIKLNAFEYVCLISGFILNIYGIIFMWKE